DVCSSDLVEQHIEKRRGQYIGRRRGTHGHADFTEHVIGYRISRLSTLTVPALQQGQQAAPVELNLPAVATVGGMQQHRVVTNNPTVALIAETYLNQITGHRAGYLLPGLATVYGSLDQPTRPDTDQGSTDLRNAYHRSRHPGID